MDKSDKTNQFRIIQSIIRDCIENDNFDSLAQSALENSAEASGISGCTLIIWDSKFEPTMTASYMKDAETKQKLDELEDNLFLELRKKQNLVSAYISFGGKNPSSAFTLPLRIDDKIYGAVIGIKIGIGSLVSLDDFLTTLTGMLALTYRNSLTDEIITEQQKRVVKATGAVVNHRINNDLQAIIGMVQIILRDNKIKDPETIDKLELILKSSNKIMQIPRQLLQIDDIKFTEYIDGTEMLDLLTDEDKEDE